MKEQTVRIYTNNKCHINYEIGRMINEGYRVMSMVVIPREILSSYSKHDFNIYSDTVVVYEKEVEE